MWIDENKFKISNAEYYSYDGEKIPIVLIHSKNVNPLNPQFRSKVLLKSYGCYGMTEEIGFNMGDWIFLWNNYIIAYPMIRGGGDKGVKWHRDSLKSNKFKSVEDLKHALIFLDSSGLSHPSMIGCFT